MFNNNNSDKIELIGGYDKVFLDSLKKTKINSNYKYHDIKITEKNIINEIKKGFNPNYIYLGNPVIFLAPNQEVLDILEYLSENSENKLANLQNLSDKFISEFMFKKYVNQLIDLHFNKLISINNVNNIKLLNEKGVDFNKIHNTNYGWHSLYFGSKDYDNARKYLLNDTNLDLSLKIRNEKVRPIKTEFPAWFLTAYICFGAEWTFPIEAIERNIKTFDEIRQYSIDISQTTENGSTILWVFQDNSQRTVIEVLKYFMIKLGLNPYYKNLDGISFVDCYLKNKKTTSLFIKFLESYNKIELFKNSPELVIIKTNDDINNNQKNEIKVRSHEKGEKYTLNQKKLENFEVYDESIILTRIREILSNQRNLEKTLNSEIINNEFIIKPYGKNLGWFHIIGIYLCTTSLDHVSIYDIKRLYVSMKPYIEKNKNQRGENIFFILRHLRRFLEFRDIFEEQINNKYYEVLKSIVDVFINLDINPFEKNKYYVSFYDLIKNDSEVYFDTLVTLENSKFYEIKKINHRNILNKLSVIKIDDKNWLLELHDEDISQEYFNPRNSYLLYLLEEKESSNNENNLIRENNIEFDFFTLTTALNDFFLENMNEEVQYLLEIGMTFSFDELKVNLGYTSIFTESIRNGIWSGKKDFVNMFEIINKYRNSSNLNDINGNNIYVYIDKYYIEFLEESFNQYSRKINGNSYDKSLILKVENFISQDIKDYFRDKAYLTSLGYPSSDDFIDYLYYLENGLIDKSEKFVIENYLNFNNSETKIIHKLIDSYIKKEISLNIIKKAIESYIKMGFNIDERFEMKTPLLKVVNLAYSIKDNKMKNGLLELAYLFINFGANINAIDSNYASVIDRVNQINNSKNANKLYFDLVNLGAKSARIQFEEVGATFYSLRFYGY